jgi:putative toxin-antitoxin system antitoxin component (TIGR02293 family)
MADRLIVEDLVEVLGGERLLNGRAGQSAQALRDLVNAGLPYGSVEVVRERLELTVPETAALLRVPERTLARRKASQRLAPDESDRLYRVARIVARATSVFGNEEKATAWLRRSNRALNGASPLGLLDTDAGAHEVDETLGRIEHGIVG